MAVVSESGATIITPTASKWYIGAAILAALGLATGAYVALVVAAAVALFGSGRFNRIVLRADGFEYRNFTTHKRFAWHEVSDFGLREYRTNLFFSTKLITFTEHARRDSLYGKFSRAMTGGTHSVPALGMEGQHLLSLFRAYAGGAPPQAVQAPTPVQSAPAPKPAAPPKAILPKPAARPAPVLQPVDLVTNGRARARQTKGWPYA